MHTDNEDELTREERLENDWWDAGWVAVWTPTASSPTGVRTRYWARRGDPATVELYRGSRVPPTSYERAEFSVREGRAFRDEGHPDGPSSVPYYVVRRLGVYPSEGFPSGPDERRHFEVRNLRRHGIQTSIRPNTQTPDGPA